MTGTSNPYNCSLPGHLFVGYEQVREKIRSGFRNAKSYSLQGGRRCGKTSLLLKIQQDIETKGLDPIRPITCKLDMQAFVPRSTFDFFNAIYSRIVEGVSDQAWEASRSTQPYQEFLSGLDQARSAIEMRYGPDWAVVLLIDELDLAAAKMPDDECFHNFRHLLMNSRFRRHFRAIASGVTGMSSLIQGGGSPLNNLDPEYLAILSVSQARQLISSGFPEEVEPQMERKIFELTGRHPYLMQAFLGYLWDSRHDVNDSALALAARRLFRDRMGTFRQWLKDLQHEGCAVYKLLSDSQGGSLSRSSVLARAAPETDADQALSALAYHGLVDDSSPDKVSIAGTLFRSWFRVHYRWLKEPEAPSSSLTVSVSPPSARQQRSPRKVFVVHGRNELLRVAMFNFLRSLGLEPLEWTEIVEATQNPVPYIGDVLIKGFEMAQAAVVLLTPDDEARLSEELLSPSDPQYEGQLNPQPRPNVLFEAGMALALRRKETVLVQIGPMRPFSDISGLHVLRMDNSFQKREELIRRLSMAGCQVNKNKDTYWHQAGDFSLQD